ncbi:MAG TPA: IclR family transcriptional regulator [Caulobacteraceae bacterium]|jgi:DNA-binding IclR family transcriptional regulator|nr:IclR family transcriptional regulator [Caulobacteraceae bacterium]
MSDKDVKSARRVFEVLEYFDRERRPLGLKEIAGHLGYPSSSASVLLKSIVTQGYLDYDRAHRAYFPTMRIAVLGGWVHEALFGEGDLSRLMDHLRAVTQETIILATRSDLHAQYVHVIHSGEPLQVSAPPGVRRPLGKSGMGWLLLSALPDKEIEAIRRRINAEPDQQPKLTPAELMERVNAARGRGYVFSKHTVSEGAGIIASLLPHGPFGRTFAIGVAGPVRRLEQRETAILRELREGVARFMG